jgi:hypothetical protein
MKPLLFLLAATVLVACSETTTQPPPPAGHLVVHVYYDGTGLADRTLEIVETGDKLTTDENGLAKFELAPGRYVLRAYVNHGGPPLYFDQEVEIISGHDTRVDVLDCLPCV